LQAQIIGSNRYELPGFLALALQGYSQARFSCYAADCRGFDQWRRGLDSAATQGVLFAVVGDYTPIAALAQGNSDQPWRFGPLTPLGQVQVKRGGITTATLEFYSFDPSRVSRSEQKGQKQSILLHTSL
jgi:hypothetical protein